MLLCDSNHVRPDELENGEDGCETGGKGESGVSDEGGQDRFDASESGLSEAVMGGGGEAVVSDEREA